MGGRALSKIRNKAAVQPANGGNNEEQPVGNVPCCKPGAEIKQHVGQLFLKTAQQPADHEKEKNGRLERFHCNIAAIGVGKEKAE